MRKWYKFLLDPSVKGTVNIPIDSNFKDYEKDLRIDSNDKAYKNQREFFNKYYFGYQMSRLEYYDKFLRKHLDKEKEILSLGSGRCANELILSRDGYKIICSDLEISDSFLQAKTLFPEFKYTKLNTLVEPSSKEYDTVISLSMIYLFDEKGLLSFLKNVYKSLKTGGCLILDSSCSPDNLLSFLIHDVILKYEMMLKRIIKYLTEKKLYGVAIKHYGYRRTDCEIIKSAKQCGFELLCQENYAFLVEFYRSSILRNIMKQNPIIKNFFNILGRNCPYIRMFKFRKIN